MAADNNTLADDLHAWQAIFSISTSWHAAVHVYARLHVSMLTLLPLLPPLLPVE